MVCRLKINWTKNMKKKSLKHRVTGVGTFLWHDFWNQLGPLLPRFGDRIIYDSAIHRNAHVAEVIGGGRWNWPIANSADLIDIKNSCGDYPIDDSREDSISWSLTSSGVFTVTSAWNQIRPRMQVVDWHASVWFPQAIRRHVFIVWLVIHDRLDTQDKLLKWGLIDENQNTKDNSDSGGCETLETPNIFLFPSVLSFITILIRSCLTY